jgi:UTP--glucose-1-phosphate uridylyltransferase
VNNRLQQGKTIRKRFKPIAERLHADGMPQLLIDTFCRHYATLLEGEQPLLRETDIAPVDDIPDAGKLEDYQAQGRNALSRTVVFKLNGGLGTSMGLHKPKSLLPVKDNLTFLDVIVQQIQRLREKHNAPVPLILMDSFSTQQETAAALKKYPDFMDAQKGIPVSFLQHRVPKIRQDNFKPVDHPDDAELEWCPPGHGDFYTALVTSGVLKKLLDADCEYAFVSNADNLGATLDLQFLGYMAEHNIPFMMEVTDRTEADKKGGHLARSDNGRLLLREKAQCPDGEMKSFQDISKYRFFNTNNLWINLKQLARKLEETDNMLDLPLMANQKTVDPRDPDSTPVYQLETAMGAAISVFPDAQALRVHRSRFAPVKTTSDMLALWSDVYVLDDDMHMVVNPRREMGPVVIELDATCYRNLDDFQAAFPEGPPSLLHCRRLRMDGKLKFESGVTLGGDVLLRNKLHRTILVPGGTVIQTFPLEADPFYP